MSIAEFIGQVPEAPNPHVIQRAVKVNCISVWISHDLLLAYNQFLQMLQWMDALDPWENVTDLGRLLLELPVEPRAGKMLLTATVLHCLDPVLTIVCCLSHRDPFILPAEPNEKKVAAARKLELSAGTLSDHMAMLRAFNLWLSARSAGNLPSLLFYSASLSVTFCLSNRQGKRVLSSSFFVVCNDGHHTPTAHSNIGSVAKVWVRPQFPRAE